MSGKFDNVPVESDTKILFQLETRFGNYDVLYQKWFWDGVNAESLIFATEDIVDISDDQLKMEVRNSPLLKKNSRITIKRLENEFTFVNFNFEIS